jgi:hypothetical protein
MESHKIHVPNHQPGLIVERVIGGAAKIPYDKLL